MSLIESPPLAGTARNINVATTWTDERIAELKRYWVIEGMSARQVADELGGFEHCADGGRSAVIGKVHRLNLETRCRMPRTPDLADTRKRVRPNRPKTRHVAGFIQKRAAEVRQPRDAEAAPDILSDTPCSLLELSDENCHWPIGDPCLPDFHFCGGPAVRGMPYCGGHCRIAYTAPAVRQYYREPAGS